MTSIKSAKSRRNREKPESKCEFLEIKMLLSGFSARRMTSLEVSCFFLLEMATEEDILEKFYGDLPEEDDEEKEANTIEISHAMEFEFLNAFRLIAGEGVESVPREKVGDILRALGYTFQSWDIDL